MGFWKNVEDRRIYLGLTRKDLAQQAGIKYAVIGAGLERDSIPAANTALRISKVLKNPPKYNRDDSQTRSGCDFIINFLKKICNFPAYDIFCQSIYDIITVNQRFRLK